jgi:thioredoxin-related protein
MDTDGSVAAQYRVRGIPHFVLIDARGKVQFVSSGFRTGNERQFEELLKRAIELARENNPANR